MPSPNARRDFRTTEWAAWAAIVAALVLRFWFVTAGEHPYDMGVNETWMRSAVTYGVAQSFHVQVKSVEMPNHGPLEIGLYGLAGLGYELFASAETDEIEPWLTFFAKLPAMLFDIAAALAVLAVCRMLTTERRARLWALAALFHPAAIYLSSLWGQTDVVYSTLVFLSMSCLAARRPGFAGTLFAAAMLHKPNAMLFAPVIGLLTLRDLKTFIRFAMAWAFVMAGTHLYFVLSGSEWTYLTLLDSSSERAGRGFGNALNFWRIVFGDGMWNRGAGDECLYGISCYRIGWGAVCLLSLPFLWIAWASRKATEGRITFMFAAASSTSLAVYLFATGMHERYLFPYVLLAIPFAQRGWLQATAYCGVSLFYLVSVMDHWRPVAWFDVFWTTPFADASARLLLAFGLFHMTLVLLDFAGVLGRKKKSAAKKPPRKKRVS